MAFIPVCHLIIHVFTEYIVKACSFWGQRKPNGNKGFL